MALGIVVTATLAFDWRSGRKNIPSKQANYVIFTITLYQYDA
jgi:hypothetical protein